MNAKRENEGEEESSTAAIVARAQAFDTAVQDSHNEGTGAEVSAGLTKAQTNE